MATLAAAAARRTAAVARLSSPQISGQSVNLIQRRGLARASGHRGRAKINCWDDPMSPSKWKKEHGAIVLLSGWGLIIYAAYRFTLLEAKVFAAGKDKKEEVKGSH